MRDGSGPFGTLILAGGAAVLLGGMAPAGQDVSLVVDGLRNDKGVVLACLTTNVALFPNCKHDPQARKVEVRAVAGRLTLDFGRVPPGTYAIAFFHDENGNGKFDTAFMMPREGFGFSRDAKVRFGPPRFDAAAFTVGSEPIRQSAKVRYMF
ncbi:MAG TPA: DUF2141 domain-containing protein [Novosphingobium sp.]